MERTHLEIHLSFLVLSFLIISVMILIIAIRERSVNCQIRHKKFCILCNITYNHTFNIHIFCGIIFYMTQTEKEGK